MAFGEIHKLILHRWQSEWPKGTSLACAEFTAFVTLVIAASPISDAGKLSLPQIVMIGVILAGILVLWLVSRRMPKARKGTVGFAVALVTEKGLRGKVSGHFVQTLRELLCEPRPTHPFSLVEMQPYHAQQAIALLEQTGRGVEADAARRAAVLKGCRCQFLIYGRTRTGRIDGEEHHRLTLCGVVWHRHVPKIIAQRFSREFTELLPRMVDIPFTNDIRGFQLASSIVNIVARYVIGIASLLSEDYDYSQSLFEGIQPLLDGKLATLPAVNLVRERLPDRLTVVYVAQARVRYNQWRRTRDVGQLAGMKSYLDKLRRLAPSDYSGHLLHAIWFFAARRKVKAAIRELRQCRGRTDMTWELSLAFLYAYQGRLDVAHKHYQIAFRGTYGEHVPIEVEEFMEWVLAVEPRRIEMHFCLGMVNYLSTKRDLLRAHKDFQQFLEKCPASEHPKARERASRYVEEIWRTLQFGAPGAG